MKTVERATANGGGGWARLALWMGLAVGGLVIVYLLAAPPAYLMAQKGVISGKVFTVLYEPLAAKMYNRTRFSLWMTRYCELWGIQFTRD